MEVSKINIAENFNWMSGAH